MCLGVELLRRCQWTSWTGHLYNNVFVSFGLIKSRMPSASPDTHTHRHGSKAKSAAAVLCRRLCVKRSDHRQRPGRAHPLQHQGQGLLLHAGVHSRGLQSPACLLQRPEPGAVIFLRLSGQTQPLPGLRHQPSPLLHPNYVGHEEAEPCLPGTQGLPPTYVQEIPR